MHAYVLSGVLAAPSRFSDPGCKGVTRNGVLTKDVCVPTAAHEADFQVCGTSSVCGIHSLHVVF